MTPTTAAVMPASAAAIAYRRGEFERVLDCLLPARHNLWQMGGSHAQRDLFYQLLIDAAHRLERNDIVGMLMAELGGIGFDRLAERSSYAEAIAGCGNPV